MEVFVEQPLASPGSANYMILSNILNTSHCISRHTKLHLIHRSHPWIVRPLCNHNLTFFIIYVWCSVGVYYGNLNNIINLSVCGCANFVHRRRKKIIWYLNWYRQLSVYHALYIICIVKSALLSVPNVVSTLCNGPVCQGFCVLLGVVVFPCSLQCTAWHTRFWCSLNTVKLTKHSKITEMLPLCRG